jgi:hypothetical protein
MELKLTIYKGKEIEKTYTAQDYNVMYGTVEDLLDLLDLDALTGKDKGSMLSAVSRLMKSRQDVINPLMLDIFEGLTEDELRRTKAIDVVNVILGLAGFSFDQLRGLAFRGRK